MSGMESTTRVATEVVKIFSWQNDRLGTILSLVIWKLNWRWIWFKSSSWILSFIAALRLIASKLE
jgi:hypothetical protein